MHKKLGTLGLRWGRRFAGNRFLFFCFFSLLLITTAVSVGLADSDRPDSDKDGWPDDMEIKLQTDPQNKESQPSSIEDPDLDGLTNLEERAHGTDPTDPDTDNDGLSDWQETFGGFSNPLKTDSDRDGSNDLTEILDGTSSQLPDSDGDGWLDGAEKTAGSDPLNPASTPKIK